MVCFLYINKSNNQLFDLIHCMWELQLTGWIFPCLWVFLTCLLCCCITGSCRQSKLCCRNPFTRSPRSTNVCQWRTRSCCGSSITETWVAPARHLPPPPRPPTPSASNRLAAPACSPALLSHPDNDGPVLLRSRPSRLSYPPGFKSHVCFLFA